MESQGASFALDPTMELSAAFATPEQQQFAKSSMEGNTTASFGDEGIDTTTSMDPAMFNAIQEQIFVPPNVAIENSSGCTPVWDTQLTFPPTPVQPFNSMYQPEYGNSLGKRPLPLDQLDCPLAKRHESMSNAMSNSTLFPYVPANDSVTTSAWGLDAQLTPPVSTTDSGLSDEAADLCATWFHKFNVLPSDRHIESLSQLTGESAEAIRSWFSGLLKQGLGDGWSDSAYKSQTRLTQHDSFWDDSYSTHTLQASPSQFLLQQTANITTPEALPSQPTTTVQPAAALRGNRKRCTPTDDPQLLSRDTSKIYQCTRKCGKRYGRKCDWKRNEEEGYPCKSWVCSLCTGEGVENVRPCFRKYHFVQHFRNIHPGVDADDHEETSIVCSETEFPKGCGFCRHYFVSRQDRIDHIADHFKAGKCMLDWREEDNNNGNEPYHTEDNNDNESTGNGFGGAGSHPPPSFNPRGGAESKFHGKGGGYGGGLSAQPDHGHNRTRSHPIDQYITKQRNFYNGQDQLSASHDTGENLSPGSLAGTWSARDKQTPTAEPPTAEHCQISLARAKPFQSNVKQNLLFQPFLEQQSLPSEGANNQVAAHPVNSGLTITDCLITANLGIDSETSHQNGISSRNEENTQYPTDSKRFRDPENCPRSLNDALRFWTNSSTLPSAPLPQLPRIVPPNSRLFSSVKLLGVGGFSTVDEVVHRGTHLHLSRKTLKNRDENAVEELKKEINVLKKLRHPHVIRFLDAYSNGDKMSILLSPVAETTLALWLERAALQRPHGLPETIVKMFGCLTSSVRYLHEQRPVIKHMDIKPQNILILDGDGALPQVILCDFGISSSETLSDEHCMPVTRQYTAPEAFQGSMRKQAADIWSLGCVFAEMASVPFSQDNVGWTDFRQVFSGRTGKYYWQDIPEVQARLSICLDEATSATEQTVARTLKSMLSSQQSERPDAASLSMIFTPAPCCLNWANKNVVFPGPCEELDCMESLDSGECVYAQHHTCEISPEPTNNEVSIAEKWLEDCSHSHEACRRLSRSNATVLPRYLVDLLPDGQTGSSNIRVVESIDIEQAANRIEYVTLSHVWSHGQLLLSSTTMLDLQSGVSLDRLPDAINKAITITQRLGYRYIWTDSLCVIQDSMTEKQQQCKAMASIFRNADLTVVLDQLIPDGTVIAPPAQRTDNRQSPPSSSLPSERNNPHPCHLPSPALSTPGFAWDTRAWVLQERLLSRRFLHLGKQFYWECNALKASASLPHGLSPLLWEKVHSRDPHAQANPEVPRSATQSSWVCGIYGIESQGGSRT